MAREAATIAGATDGRLLALIGAEIRRHRQRRHLTQVQLADLADVTQTRISAYENGNREMSITTALRVARALRVRLDHLVQFVPK